MKKHGERGTCDYCGANRRLIDKKDGDFWCQNCIDCSNRRFPKMGSLKNKTIESACKDEDGNLKINFTDGTGISVTYDCRGGVAVWDEQYQEITNES